MRLTAKLFLAFCLTTLLVLAASGYLSISRERDLFEQDMRRDAVSLAATLARATEEVALQGGITPAQAVVKHASEHAKHATLRWVSLEHNPALPEPQLPVSQLLAPETREMKGASGEPGSLVTYVPVNMPALGATAIEFEESLDEEANFMRGSILRTLSTTLALFGLTAVVTGLFGIVMVTRPLRALLLKARRARQGDLSGAVIIQQNDEIRDLADEFNQMCVELSEARQRLEAEYHARIAALEQVRRTDRLATVGQLAAGLAHEVGTPLGVIAGRAQMIASGEVVEREALDSARIVAEQAKRISGIVRQLLDFARKRPPEMTAVDLRALARSTSELLEPMARKQGVVIELAPEETVGRAKGDAGQLLQVLTNLVVNALQATPRGKKVELSVRPAKGAAGWVAVAVRDQGSGISPEVREHVFEPFFTTKDVGEGTGLGLSVAHGIVEEHGGTIEVDTEVGSGSCFTIRLPAAEEGRT